MIFKLLPMVLLVGVAFFVFRNLGKRTAAAQQNLGPALHTFLERTGYRMLGSPDASLEEHVKLATAAMAPMWAAQAYEFTVVRDVHGGQQEHMQAVEVHDEGGRTMWANWSAKRDDSDPYVGFQVAAKSLTSTFTKSVKEALTKRHRHFGTAYSTQFESGDAELDDAFDFFAEEADVEKAQRAIASKGVKEALLSLEEVSVVVNDDGVFFNDPFQKNLLSGVGGTAGLMAIGGDPAKYYDLVAPVHDTIAELIAVVDRASRKAAGGAARAAPAAAAPAARPPPRVLKKGPPKRPSE